MCRVLKGLVGARRLRPADRVEGGGAVLGDLNTIWHAVFLVLALVAVSLLGQYLVNKAVKIEVLEKHHSAGEAMMGVVGTLFSVLLGFMVAGAMDKYHDAKMYGEMEASRVANLFRISQGFSDSDRPRLRKLCRAYLDDVINVEWPQMERHEIINHGWQSYQKLWEAAVAVVPENDRQSNLQQGLIGAIQEMGDSRRARILLSESTLPAALWLVVCFGAVLTIALSYVFASQHPKVQSFLTTLVASALALNIWLLAAYTHPYSGELKVTPSMFILVRQSIEKSDDGPSPYLHDSTTK